MKVFITVEVERGDMEKGGMSDETYTSMMDLIDVLRLEGISTQYKSTNIPRRGRGFISASELNNIER